MPRRAPRTIALCAPCFLALAVPTPPSAAAPPNTPTTAPPAPSPISQTRVLVQLARGLRPAGPATLGFPAVDAVLARSAVADIAPAIPFTPDDPALAAAIGLDRWWVLTTPDGAAPALAAELMAFPDIIARAQPDGIGGPADLTPNDTFFELQWDMLNTGQDVPHLGLGTPGADISATQAWATSSGRRDLVLAVIDSGVDPHSELAGRMIPGWSSIDDGLGTADQCAHGTHVAGIAAARGNNAAGIAGVCWSARILPVRVIEGDCWGEESQAAAGIVWAADHGASIANISLQYYTGTQVLADAVEYAHSRGVLLIAAAGNQAGGIVAFPAAFDHCMAVSGTDNHDAFAAWSNYGPEIDVAAPGAWVYSLLGTGDYKYDSGTSMACPHVAGLACLIWSIDPALTADEVADIIVRTADDLGPVGWDPHFGAGRINAAAALAATPCYADLDQDGQTDFIDLLAFQNAFLGHDPAADCDRSSGTGVFDLFDFLCFQNAFTESCP